MENKNDKVLRTCRTVMLASLTAAVVMNASSMATTADGEQNVVAADKSTTTVAAATTHISASDDVLINGAVSNDIYSAMSDQSYKNSENNINSKTSALEKASAFNNQLPEIKVESALYKPQIDTLHVEEDTDNKEEEVTYEDVDDPNSPTMGTSDVPEDMQEETYEEQESQREDITYNGYWTNINGMDIYVNPILNPNWDSSGHLNSFGGTYNGPSGRETYYNLDMSGVVSIMRNMGYDAENWPYWVRDDGCKMLGDYIMVAADLDIRARGSLVETSQGTGIVCDTGSFIYSNPTQLDIATSW